MRESCGKVTYAIVDVPQLLAVYYSYIFTTSSSRSLKNFTYFEYLLISIRVRFGVNLPVELIFTCKETGTVARKG